MSIIHIFLICIITDFEPYNNNRVRTSKLIVHIYKIINIKDTITISGYLIFAVSGMYLL